MKARVIISYFNGIEFIKEQVDSILKQKLFSGLVLEIYIYNDGSKSNDLKKLFLDYKNLKILTHMNKGFIGTCIKGLHQATKDKIDFVFIADQDDIGLDNKVIYQLKHMNNTNIVISSHQSYKGFYKTGKLEKIENYGLTSAHTQCINLNLFNKITKISYESFLEFTTNHKDKEKYKKEFFDVFLLRLIQLFKLEVSRIKDIYLIKHRNHASSITNNSKNNFNFVISDQYNYYYKYIKPLFKISFNKNYTKVMFVKHFHMNIPKYLRIITFPYLCLFLFLKIEFLYNLPWKLIKKIRK